MSTGRSIFLKNRLESSILITLVIIFIIFVAFPINIHTWESYYYALSIDGKLSLVDIFSYLSPEKADVFQNYKFFDFYHPSHPLIHFIIYIFSNLLNFETIKITQFINTSFSILTLIFVNKILRLQSKDIFIRVTILLLLSFSNLFWYQALSGEVYTAPLFFIVTSIYFFCKFTREEKKKYLHLSLFFSGIATCFHLLSFFYLLTLLIFISSIYKTKHLRSLFYGILYLSSLSIIFYFIPLSLGQATFKVSNIFGLIFLYSGQIGANLGDLLTVNGILKNFSLATTQALYSISNYQIFNYIFIILATLTIFKKRLSSIQKLLVSVIFVYFFVITYFLNLPSVTDYWYFILTPFFIVVGLSLENLKIYQKAGLVSFICLLLIFNFKNEIYPKYKYKFSDIHSPNMRSIHLLSSEPYSHEDILFIWNLYQNNIEKVIYAPISNDALEDSVNHFYSNTNDFSYFQSYKNFKVTKKYTIEVLKEENRNSMERITIDNKKTYYLLLK